MKPLFILYFILLTAIFSTECLSQSQTEGPFVTSSDGVSIAYEVNGKGLISLVFVHGWSCDKSYWKEQLKYFSKNYKVVTIDLGGHGKSGLGRKDWTIFSFGSDVAAVVNKLDLEKIVLIGHSMGGDVIADAARLLPGRVEGLVMVDTYKEIGTGRTPAQVEAFVSKFRNHFSETVRSFVKSLFLPGSDSSLVAFVEKDMSSAPPSVALSALESSFNHSREITSDFKELKLPVVAINPDNEPTDMESMRRYGVEVIIMPRVGHFLMMEDPKHFNELLEVAINKIIK